MKLQNRLIIAGILLLFVMPSIFAMDNCNEGMRVYIELKAFNSANLEKISDYQSPDYMEDDYLTLWGITVENNGNCISEESILDLHFNNSETEVDDFFCSYGINIPELEPEGKYFLSRTDLIERIDLGGSFIERPIYRDVNGKNFTFCTTYMLTTGIWEAEAFLDPIDKTKSTGSWGYTLVDEGKYAHLKFKVRSKQELLALEQQKKSFWISIIIITLIGLATVLAQIWSVLWQNHKKKRSESEKQISLLESLYSELDAISSKKRKIKFLNEKISTIGNLQWVKENLGGKFLHAVWNLNVLIYIQGLNSKINKIETKNLKDALIHISQKIEMIRNVISEYDLKSDLDMKKSLEEIIDELIGFIDKIKQMIKKDFKINR